MRERYIFSPAQPGVLNLPLVAPPPSPTTYAFFRGAQLFLHHFFFKKNFSLRSRIKVKKKVRQFFTIIGHVPRGSLKKSKTFAEWGTEFILGELGATTAQKKFFLSETFAGDLLLLLIK